MTKLITNVQTCRKCPQSKGPTLFSKTNCFLGVSWPIPTLWLSMQPALNTTVLAVLYPGVTPWAFPKTPAQLLSQNCDVKAEGKTFTSWNDHELVTWEWPVHYRPSNTECSRMSPPPQIKLSFFCPLKLIPSLPSGEESWSRFPGIPSLWSGFAHRCYLSTFHLPGHEPRWERQIPGFWNPVVPRVISLSTHHL